MTISILRNHFEGSSLNAPVNAYLDWCAERLLNYQVPGALIGLVSGQGLDVLASFGHAHIDGRVPFAPEHRFRIASITKLFTSVAIMQLHERGNLSIHEPLSKFLPWFRSSSSNLDAITPWHLLTHSSGLSRESGMSYWNDHKFPSLEQLKQHVAELEPVYAPEFLWKYSNFGMALLGYTVSAVSGVSFEDYLREHILSPLQMNDTLVSDPGAGHPSLATGYSRFSAPNSTRAPAPHSDLNALTAAGGMTTTIEDLAKFIHFNLVPEQFDILKYETLREMHRVHWLDPSWEFGIGLGFLNTRVNGQTFLGHDGWIRGYRSSILFATERQLGVILFFNCDFTPIQEFATKCFEFLPPSLPVNQTQAYPHRLSQVDLSKTVGLYTSQFGTCRIADLDGALVILYPSNPNALRTRECLEYVSEGRYRLHSTQGAGSRGETVKLIKDNDGRVLRVKVGTFFYDRVM